MNLTVVHKRKFNEQQNVLGIGNKNFKFSWTLTIEACKSSWSNTWWWINAMKFSDFHICHPMPKPGFHYLFFNIFMFLVAIFIYLIYSCMVGILSCYFIFKMFQYEEYFRRGTVSILYSLSLLQCKTNLLDFTYKINLGRMWKI